MPPKRELETEEETADKKPRFFRRQFFHPFPKSQTINKAHPIGLFSQECPIFWADPACANQCSPVIRRAPRVFTEGKEFVELQDVSPRALGVFTEWAIRHAHPELEVKNGVEGNVLDDFLALYLDTEKLEAFRLRDLLTRKLCNIGAKNDLIVTEEQIETVYKKTNRNNPLRGLTVATIGYQQRKGLSTPFLNSKKARGMTTKEIEKLEREACLKTTDDFKLDLMKVLSKTALKNPCLEPEKYIGNVIEDDDEEQKEDEQNTSLFIPLD